MAKAPATEVKAFVMDSASGFVVRKQEGGASIKLKAHKNIDREIHGNIIRERHAKGRESFKVKSLLANYEHEKGRGVSVLDFVKNIRIGIAADSIYRVADYAEIPITDVANALHINTRTISRRKGGRLSSEESEKVIRMGRVMERTSEVFGEGGIEWIKQPNKALGGQTPLSLLDTDIGTESVLDTLGRIEHGVFA